MSDDTIGRVVAVNRGVERSDVVGPTRGAPHRALEAWIGRWNGRLSYRRPDAGGMAFVRYDWPIGSAELSRIARERESVFVVAGEWFGMDGHLRIGTGGEPHVLEEGLARLDRLFATL